VLRECCACHPRGGVGPYSFVKASTKEALVSSLNLGRWAAIGAVVAVVAVGIVLLVVYGGGGGSGGGY
jgi:hypothetical protein